MIKVTVPATTANIGSGFDCLGVALSLYNSFIFEEIDEGLIIEGCEEKYKNEENLVYRSMKICFKEANYKDRGIKISMNTSIPESRGLGSSASCIIAGVVGANELMGKPFNIDKILNIATVIEGHPDNIAPAFLGSAIVSVLDENKVYYNKINMAKEFKFCALIPDFTLSTEKSREVLPKNISYKDAIFNVGRVAAMISGFANGNLELITVGCQDKLHQQYRGLLIEDYEIIMNECKKHSIGTFLSGAGPTIMNIINSDDLNFTSNIDKFLKKLNNKWSALELNIDFNGVMTELI